MKEEIQMVCQKCGKFQQPDKEQSNSNWQVFNAKEKCECGGEFKMQLIKSNTK